MQGRKNKIEKESSIRGKNKNKERRVGIKKQKTREQKEKQYEEKEKLIRENKRTRGEANQKTE